MDPSKTMAWSPDAVNRRSLRRSGRSTILDGRDLGGHASFSNRHTNFTLTARLDSLQPLWARLRASPSSCRQKRLALITAAWPRGLHGVAAAPLGSHHYTRLRTGALHGLSFVRHFCMLAPTWFGRKWRLSLMRPCTWRGHGRRGRLECCWIGSLPLTGHGKLSATFFMTALVRCARVCLSAGSRFFSWFAVSSLRLDAGPPSMTARPRFGTIQMPKRMGTSSRLLPRSWQVGLGRPSGPWCWQLGAPTSPLMFAPT